MNKLILISGGSASGKTFLSKKLKNVYGDKLIYVSQDHFYKPNGTPSRNYDRPSAFDFKKQDEVLTALLKNEKTFLPVYDFSKHDVVGEKEIEPAPIIVLEGLFAFKGKIVRNADLKIFVDTPSDTRLARRVLRDVNERGRDVDEIINRWIKHVQPQHKKHISIEKHHADIVIPWSRINKKSINSLAIIISHLDERLRDILHENNI